MKGSFTKQKFCHHLLTFMAFQTCITFSLLFLSMLKVNGVHFLCMDKINLNTFFKTSNFVYWFGMKWRWKNDDSIFIFSVNYPLNILCTVIHFTYWRTVTCCWQTHWGTSLRKVNLPQGRSLLQRSLTENQVSCLFPSGPGHKYLHRQLRHHK